MYLAVFQYVGKNMHLFKSLDLPAFYSTFGCLSKIWPGAIDENLSFFILDPFLSNKKMKFNTYGNMLSRKHVKTKSDIFSFYRPRPYYLPVASLPFIFSIFSNGGN